MAASTCTRSAAYLHRQVTAFRYNRGLSFSVKVGLAAHHSGEVKFAFNIAFHRATVEKLPFALRHVQFYSTDAYGAREETQSNRKRAELSDKLEGGPSLQDFIIASNQPKSVYNGDPTQGEPVPYLQRNSTEARNRKVYFETYGCQMNVNDTEIAWAILQEEGFQKVDDVLKADVILAVTCAIRENAEQKIWNRLEYFQALKKRRRKNQPPLKVGLLGCMAERLKKEILDRSQIVDVVAGPDAYRDLPRLLSVAHAGQAAINVMLSVDETYADVVPVRLSRESKSAFISIMRGCDNMCSFCIVPFTRGRERSRPMSSILEEVRILSDQGIREVTLLGQNVNSYRDTSEATYYGHGMLPPEQGSPGPAPSPDPGPAPGPATRLARGFSTIYKPKKGGLRFADLLAQVAQVDPEMRVRFTSPHPKDFPDEVLQLVGDCDNVCKQLHMPAQSGSTEVLKRMRRGYSREAYLDLVARIRSTIRQVSLSSDFITGFCGETVSEHEDTLSLLRLVRYNYAFLFAYSMRKKTHAYHRLQDDVPEEVKQRRLREVIALCREGMAEANAEQVGQRQLVLIEGVSKRSDQDLVGRNDGNVRVVVPDVKVPHSEGDTRDAAKLQPGDYVAVRVDASNSQVLKGSPLYHTTLAGFQRAERAAADVGNSAGSNQVAGDS